MVLTKSGPSIYTEMIVAGNIEASDLANDAVGSGNVAANGIKGSHLATTALSQVIRTTGPAAGPIRDAGPTGVYSANIGATARFAWARCVGSDRIAKVFSINSNTVRLFVRSINDAGGSARLVDGVSNSITLCWMT